MNGKRTFSNVKVRTRSVTYTVELDTNNLSDVIEWIGDVLEGRVGSKIDITIATAKKSNSSPR